MIDSMKPLCTILVLCRAISNNPVSFKLYFSIHTKYLVLRIQQTLTWGHRRDQTIRAYSCWIFFTKWIICLPLVRSYLLWLLLWKLSKYAHSSLGTLSSSSSSTTPAAGDSNATVVLLNHSRNRLFSTADLFGRGLASSLTTSCLQPSAASFFGCIPVYLSNTGKPQIFAISRILDTIQLFVRL